LGVVGVKRLFDMLVSIFLILLLAGPMLMVSFAVLITTKSSVIYWSKRVGLENEIFKMPKFRTMQLGTPDVATHLMMNPDEYLTPIGGFLRSTSLDELPQLFSILKGDMSFVGPRPALFNQYDLIGLRTEKSVDQLLPGLTGWAQVNGRDECPTAEKVELDFEYLQRRSIRFDLKILWMTFLKVIKRDNIVH
jgi:O-antigen biosynthesis protein WbqP